MTILNTLTEGAKQRKDLEKQQKADERLSEATEGLDETAEEHGLINCSPIALAIFTIQAASQSRPLDSDSFHVMYWHRLMARISHGPNGLFV